MKIVEIKKKKLLIIERNFGETCHLDSVVNLNSIGSGDQAILNERRIED